MPKISLGYLIFQSLACADNYSDGTAKINLEQMCSFFFNIINSDLESFIYLTDIKEQSYKEISQINKGCIYRRHTIRTTSNQADFNYKLRTTDQKTWKQPRRPLTDKWISKIESLCTKQYYSAKKGENLPYVTTWVSLEDIMLSELRHSPKHKCC